MRKTLQKSDKISCSLKEEIEYVENYMQLQQLRFKNSFNYKIEIGKKVNLETKVPKHVLYSYVENAIKHGLTTTKPGILTIKIENGKSLVLIVEDNGGGIDTTTNTKRNSTGNGILIMEKIYKLYTQLYHKKIKHIVENVVKSNTIKGVRAKVEIDT